MDYLHPSGESTDFQALSVLALAYVGDGVFELMVRTWLCSRGALKNDRLHQSAIRFVSAPAQAVFCESLLPLLSQEEQDVFRRGRNVHTSHVPRGASRAEYQKATALEALFGWLYLRGETARLNQLFSRLMEHQEPGVSPCLPAGEKRETMENAE